MAFHFSYTKIIFEQGRQEDTKGTSEFFPVFLILKYGMKSDE